jgi:hypothetical protein
MNALSRSVTCVVIALATLPSASAADDLQTAKRVQFPTIIPRGSRGELILDLHAELNDIMRGEKILLSDGFKMTRNKDAFTTPSSLSGYGLQPGFRW